MGEKITTADDQKMYHLEFGKNPKIICLYTNNVKIEILAKIGFFWLPSNLYSFSYVINKSHNTKQQN